MVLSRAHHRAASVMWSISKEPDLRFLVEILRVTTIEPCADSRPTWRKGRSPSLKNPDKKEAGRAASLEEFHSEMKRGLATDHT